MNVRWRMRRLDGVWSSTDYHHWHHSNHREARNKNFAASSGGRHRLRHLLHAKDRRPVVYGIDDPMPDSWSRQLLHPFKRTDPPLDAPSTRPYLPQL